MTVARSGQAWKKRAGSAVLAGPAEPFQGHVTSPAGRALARAKFPPPMLKRNAPKEMIKKFFVWLQPFFKTILFKLLLLLLLRVLWLVVRQREAVGLKNEILLLLLPC